MGPALSPSSKHDAQLSDFVLEDLCFPVAALFLYTIPDAHHPPPRDTVSLVFPSRALASCCTLPPTARLQRFTGKRNATPRNHRNQKPAVILQPRLRQRFKPAYSVVAPAQGHGVVVTDWFSFDAPATLPLVALAARWMGDFGALSELNYAEKGFGGGSILVAGLLCGRCHPPFRPSRSPHLGLPARKFDRGHLEKI